jgi:Leucine-rich repeat (LRR) protein
MPCSLKNRFIVALICWGAAPLFGVPKTPTEAEPNRISVSQLLEKYGKSQVSQTKERVIHFPSDTSLGQLRIQDAGSVRQLNYWFYWTDTGEPALEYLCEAQGDVRVPAGKRLYLAVNGTTSRNLSALSKLKPDDLYGITLSALPKDPVEPGDECMPHIAHLTGLKSLSVPHITDKGLEFISNFKSLEYLNLRNRVTDRGMAYVAELPLLRGLYIEAMDSRITDAGLQHISKATSLEELVLWGERMGDAGLIHLRGLPRLKYLFLRGPHFTDAGCVHLKDIPSLRMLSYHEGVARITDAGLVHIADIPNLESLCLHGMKNITDDGIAHLSKMRTLKKLEIGSSQVTDRGLGYLSQLKTLERLELPQDQKGITDTGLAYLAQLTNLRHLAISRIHYVDPKMNKNYYTDKGLEALVKCRNLEELSIGSIGVTDAGMDHIAKLTKLKKLMLFGCDDVTDKGLAKLAGLKFMTSLHVAHLNLTISGLNQLKSLPNLTMLRVYDLRRGGAILDLSGLTNLEDLMLSFAPRSGEVFTDSDLVCLANLKRLKNLQIGPRDFTDKGMTYLAGLTNMERLLIGGTSLTDKGLESLTGMKKLYLLTISGSFDERKMAFSSGGRITDQGLSCLEGFKQLQNLEINSDSAFSAAAIRHLEDALPNLYSLKINDGSAPVRNRPMQQKAPVPRQPRTERPRVSR